MTAVLGMLSMLAPLSTDMYLPGLPSMTSDLATSTALAELTMTSVLLGLGFGQIFAGPISDALGRRRPLLFGLLAFAVASLLCALAPSVWMLIAFRLAQGLVGATGQAIARAVVRDIYSGSAAARYFAQLMVFTALGPILAPVLGGQLLRFTSWRGSFVALAIFALLLLVAAATRLPETLPASRRQKGGMRATAKVFGRLLGDGPFVACAVASALVSGSLFAYISASSFVIQEVYGLSPQLYSLTFAINACSLVLASQFSSRAVARLGPSRLVAIGLSTSVAGGLGLLIAVTGNLGLAAFLPACFFVVGSVGLVSPNITAIALTSHGSEAGSASGLLGVIVFLFGAAAAPLVGAGGAHTAVPMARVILTASLTAVAMFGLWRFMISRSAAQLS